MFIIPILSFRNDSFFSSTLIKENKNKNTMSIGAMMLNETYII